MSSTTARVLVCDDESHIVRAVQMTLTRAGLHVEACADGRAAWESIGQQPPDLLITDYQMPEMDGLELCRRLRAQPGTRYLPIVLLTAKSFELNWDELSAELRLTRVTAKPFSPRELLQTVQQTLGLVENPA